MGKSPGKWIKTVLFGKKYSKTNLPKINTAEKGTSGKTLEEEVYAANSPVISNPRDVIPLSPLDQGIESQLENAPCLITDADEIRQEQAATKAQAVVRGYLARRAFRALKGIRRLQALIRGHLVRRQAVATFNCTLAIVKIQALVRKGAVPKIAANGFVRKLLRKLPKAKPLRVRYDLSEPNADWNWLDRWSTSHFWETPALAKTMIKGKQVSEFYVGKSRRTIRKVLNGTNGVRKSMSDQAELEEQPQNELERVKHNLRKISASAAAVFEKSKKETVKPLLNGDKETNSEGFDVSKQEKLISSEDDLDVVVDKLNLLEAPLDLTMDEPIEVTPENGLKKESFLTPDDEMMNCMEEQNGKDNHKIGQRRSLATKKDCHGNISKNTRSLPSYMAATESAKAKLRAQGSPNFDEQGTDYGIGRRHSLPAYTNGSRNSLSPRMQKLVQANGKGSNKINKSLMTTGNDKAVQPGWRR